MTFLRRPAQAPSRIIRVYIPSIHDDKKPAAHEAYQKLADDKNAPAKVGTTYAEKLDQKTETRVEIRAQQFKQRLPKVNHVFHDYQQANIILVCPNSPDEIPDCVNKLGLQNQSRTHQRVFMVIPNDMNMYLAAIQFANKQHDKNFYLEIIVINDQPNELLRRVIDQYDSEFPPQKIDIQRTLNTLNAEIDTHTYGSLLPELRGIILEYHFEPLIIEAARRSEGFVTNATPSTTPAKKP
jgi:hypothetical protein